jgi:ribonuclease HI
VVRWFAFTVLRFGALFSSLCLGTRSILTLQFGVLRQTLDRRSTNPSLAGDAATFPLKEESAMIVVAHESVVLISADGACSGNPGPGGWACVLRFGDYRKSLSGGTDQTTNNRMELQAAIEGLRALIRPCRVELTVDSDYVRKGMTEWLPGWKQRGWRTASKKPVLNQEFWRQLDELCQMHTVEWKWTRGHAAHEDHNLCDQLAVTEAQKRRV